MTPIATERERQNIRIDRMIRSTTMASWIALSLAVASVAVTLFGALR